MVLQCPLKVVVDHHDDRDYMIVKVDTWKTFSGEGYWRNFTMGTLCKIQNLPDKIDSISMIDKYFCMPSFCADSTCLHFHFHRSRASVA